MRNTYIIALSLLTSVCSLAAAQTNPGRPAGKQSQVRYFVPDGAGEKAQTAELSGAGLIMNSDGKGESAVSIWVKLNAPDKSSATNQRVCILSKSTLAKAGFTPGELMILINSSPDFEISCTGDQLQRIAINK